MRSGEWERGKFDFDQYFAFLTNFLKRWNFLLNFASDSARQEDPFHKNCPKRTFPSNFVKLFSKILYLFLAEKIVVCCCLFVCLLLQLFCPILAYFFKKNFAVEWERGKFDFDHYFAILTNFLKRQHFLLSGIWFGSSNGLKKNLSKTDLPFKFCKIGLKNTLFIFGRKNGRLLFVCFVATLSDFGFLFFKLKHLSIWERCFQGMYGLGIAQPLRYPDSADLPNLQRCNWPNF